MFLGCPNSCFFYVQMVINNKRRKCGDTAQSAINMKLHLGLLASFNFKNGL